MSDLVPLAEKVAIPTFFGPAHRRCFGWLHLPASARARDLGVVLCKPFGYEAMCTHRSLRQLAEELCNAGFPVLRYDPYASGDSSGSAGDPDLVAAWLDGISAAAEMLRKSSGATRISLVGLRLGATLAAFAASRAPVESLVLWAPFRSGKLFAREAKAFQDLQGKSDARTPPGALEVAGYPLSAQTIEGLGAIDLGALETAPAKHALLLGRDDISEGTKLDDKLRALGVQVERSAAPGYAAMLLDANESQVPEQALAAIVAHLSGLAKEGSLRSLPPPASEPLLIPTGTATVLEEPVLFGDDGRLFGILTTPVVPSAGERPAVLFLNVGANHHVGPNRMYVVQARALAARGFPSLRFDVSGIGDSPAVPGARPNRLYSPEAIVDTRMAIDLVNARTSSRTAALIGLCSGAFLAFHSANRDDRVVGQALLNQQTFYWREGNSLALAMKRSVKATRVYKEALSHWDTWKRLLTGNIHVRLIAGSFLRRFRSQIAAQGNALRSFLSGQGWESSQIARLFRQSLRRGTQALLIFSDTDGGIDVMEQHLGANARKLAGTPGFRLEIIEGPDHTFTPVWSQGRVEQLLIEWVESLNG